MTTVSRLRASVIWLACGVVLLVGPVPLARGQNRERHVALVNVLDRNGNQVPGLSAVNFRGEYQGKPVRILSANPDTTPRRIAVILDRSESQLRVGQRVLKSVQELIASLTPQHSVVIGTVTESIQQRSGLTNDRQVLEQALRDIAATEPGGVSSLYEAVLRACHGLHSTTPGDVVVLFSDCDDTVSAANPSKMVTTAAQAGVRVFGVLAPGELPPSQAQRTVAWIFLLAEATGGSVSRLEGFQRELPTLHSMITDAYRLDVEFPRPVDQPKWKLEVVDADGKVLKARLVYPRLIAPLVPPR